MYIVCEKCGFMYDETGSGCPQCGNGNIQPEVNDVETANDCPQSDNGNIQPEVNVVETANDCPQSDNGNIQPEVNVVETANDCPQCDNGNIQPEVNVVETANDCPQSDNDNIQPEVNVVENQVAAPVIIESNKPEPSPYKENTGVLSPVSIDKAKEELKTKVVPVLKTKVIEPLKKHKKVATVVSSCVLAFILVICIINVIVKNSPVDLPVEAYVSSEVYIPFEVNEFEEYNDYYDDYYYNSGLEYESGDGHYFTNYPFGVGLIVRGFNNMGYISEDQLYNIIDWNGLVEETDEKLSEKKKYRGYSLSFYDVYSHKNSFEFKLSEESAKKNGKLKNGDVIEVEFEFAQYYHKDIVKCNTYTSSISFTVEGLEDVDTFDPFEYVEFVQTGVNDEGVAGVSVPWDLDEKIPEADEFRVTYYDNDAIALEYNGYDIGEIYFSFEDGEDTYSGGFSNGDKVKVLCSDIDSLAEDYGLYIAKHEKTYTFDSLGDYITESSTITDDDIKAFKAYADEYVDEEYGHYSSYSDIEFNSAYIMSVKELTEYDDYRNGMLFIYSYTYSGWFSDDETEYLYVRFEDLIADPDGNITQKPDAYYCVDNYGFESVDEIVDELYGEDYNLVKIK